MADTLLDGIRADVSIKRVEAEALMVEYKAKMEVIESAERYLAALEAEQVQREGDTLPPKATLGEGIFHVLRSGEELHRADIAARVQALGIHIGGVDPVESVGSRMASDRKKRFVKGSRIGYWKLAHPPLSAESEPPKEDAEGDVIDINAFQQASQREG